MMYDDSYGRAQVYGSLWLNAVFVAGRPKWRPFRRLSLRLSLVEMVLIPIMTVIFGALVWFVSWPLAQVPGFDKLVSPWLMAIMMGPLIGWFVGRRVAKASPYRRSTGEGLREYLFVQSDTKSHLLGNLVGRRVAVNRYVTRATGKTIVVDCAEWLGSARAPRAPKRIDPADDDGKMDLYLTPRSAPTPWVRGAGRNRGLGLAASEPAR